MNTTIAQSKTPLSLKKIFKMWWPLAGSWLLMSIEGPVMNAVIARMANPEINLAAYGGVILPISLIIEAPIIMLLVASTAMSKDYDSYRRLERFTHILSGCLTLIHLLIAFTPLYYVVVEGIIGAPAEIVEPSRIGLMIMLPWTWAIGFRRFQQGAMIRFGYSQDVMNCTFVRLVTLCAVLFLGYSFFPDVPGVYLATTAQALGVTLEATFAGILVRPIVRKHIKPAPAVEPFTWREFSGFYIPLILTSLLTFIAQPIGSAAISRMPKAVESLAVWSILSNLIFLTRSIGVAYNEVVVALLDESESRKSLQKFAITLSAVLAVVVLIFAFTPLADFWFTDVTALASPLAVMARNAWWFVLVIPPLSSFQSLFQGAITYSRFTRAVTESVLVFLGTLIVVFLVGIMIGNIEGIYVGAVGFACANLSQLFWLWLRGRHVLRKPVS